MLEIIGTLIMLLGAVLAFSRAYHSDTPGVIAYIGTAILLAILLS